MRRWHYILRYSCFGTYVCRAFPDSDTAEAFADHIARLWGATILDTEYRP